MDVSLALRECRLSTQAHQADLRESLRRFLAVLSMVLQMQSRRSSFIVVAA